MDKFAIWSRMEVKPGKEQELEAFLKHAHTLIAHESGTTTFYTLKVGSSTYSTFNTFADEAALNAHVNGSVAKALLARSDELFLHPPQIVKTTIIEAKVPNEQR
jgi:quinol monooxygenase YgiN